MHGKEKATQKERVEWPCFHSVEPHLSHALIQFKRCSVLFFTHTQHVTKPEDGSAQAGLPQVRRTQWLEAGKGRTKKKQEKS